MARSVEDKPCSARGLMRRTCEPNAACVHDLPRNLQCPFP
jgi:hypothetical protein